ncbi:bifunctional phosphoribosyl-AMP cyclohydrolase/phosphoribosyl-ATP diphosphatase HisIE [Robiginitalea aurantiaca]|uniref:Histidine biosynthesis bifunctional protein HisIE n=1 Tax=Robiginitalea aurantiaca TaxID=3056915 RepID=A0ABT7WFT9_9FLAO|nr:bifunctional phosphoribosyl-AMP cyclohydrolase/phosphoribosyl-ATP diphosphatase HisIE [Robiginitalea aurantiaca]MDM9631782.1 bifunctional phosphoribosyl-AMP cyclohydrolase/phosphoribosyl-ATP diphosphatase HisIE [Robiginitalea aurantiaca]
MEEIDFTKGDGLVPAVIQDAQTAKVLMLGYMNREALEKTKATGLVTFYSRSKKRLWTKGEESGNHLHLEGIRVDCDNDTLLVRVRPLGPVCHKGTDTCWGEVNEGVGFLDQLEAVIASRKEEAGSGASKSSYVASLFDKGINKIAQKVGEEAVETIIEAMDSQDELFLNESADLLFHLMVLVQAKGFTLKDVVSVLETRHQPTR